MMRWNPRNSRFLWITLGIFVAAVLLFLIRAALFPFVLGVALAYVLHPFVTFLERVNPWRQRWPVMGRIGSIFIVFIVFFGLLSLALIVVIPPVIRETSGFVAAIPELLNRAIVTVESWNEQYADRIPEEIRQELQNLLQNASSVLIETGQNLIGRTIGAVSRALTVVIGLAIVPLFLYYLLKDKEGLLQGLASLFPWAARPHVRAVVMEVNDVLGSYFRAQIFLGFLVGFSVWLGLFILGVPFSVLLGLVAGVFELVPIIGPWLGAIPGVLVTLATSPEDLVWVVLLYLGIQLAENAFLVPRIHSRSLDLHPVVIMMVLVIGSEVAGLWGIVLGPPLTAATVRIFAHFRRQEAAPAEAAQTEAATAEQVETATQRLQPPELVESDAYERADG
ncbi:MAG: AI-2E family transporter [Chloroflexi bacterium]|nr:AI-2E family transporter [Chloroflexota bacterium]